jgi:hypothetical protein
LRPVSARRPSDEKAGSVSAVVAAARDGEKGGRRRFLGFDAFGFPIGVRLGDHLVGERAEACRISVGVEARVRDIERLDLGCERERDGREAVDGGAGGQEREQAQRGDRSEPRARGLARPFYFDLGPNS